MMGRVTASRHPKTTSPSAAWLRHVKRKSCSELSGKFMQRVRQRRDWAEGREVVPVDDDIGAEHLCAVEASLRGPVTLKPRGLEQVVEENEANLSGIGMKRRCCQDEMD